MRFGKKLKKSKKEMAPDAGFEPATKRLTAAYSTAELIRNLKKNSLKKI